MGLCTGKQVTFVPAMYPPADAKLFVNVPIMTSISLGSIPK